MQSAQKLLCPLIFQQALCAPSRNSILTSRRPDTIRLYDFYSYWRTFAGNFTTLPQYFKEHGYFTYSIGKVFHPGASSNFTDDYPYSWSEPTYHPRSEKYLNAAVCLEANGNFVANLLCPIDLNIFPGHILPDIDSTLHAKHILGANKDYFFLAIGYHKPHIPFQFPSKYLEYHQDLEKFAKPEDDFKPYDMPDVAWNPFEDIRRRADVKEMNLTFPFQTLPRDFRLKTRQHYYASVTYIDDLIGQLLKSVNLTNTIIVLTSDHGWSLGEHTEWAKYSEFEVALKVPLLIYDGGKTEKVSTISEAIDIFPTVVELAGLPKMSSCSASVNLNACTEGKSLLSMEMEGNAAVSQYPRPGVFPTLLSDKPRLNQIQIMGYSIRTKQFRYTIWIRFDPKTLQKGKYAHT